MSGSPAIDLSVVIPVFNERESLPELFRRLRHALDSIGRTWEVVFVDDGSSDGSVEILKAQAAAVPAFRVVELARNFGQHAAVLAGFSAVRGSIVVTLDADLQNPPEEIPKLLAEIDAGADVVGGYRAARQDSPFRLFVSRLANVWIARSTGIRIRDYGCMLRAYRRWVVDRMVGTREVSSFVPALAHCFTHRISEVAVAHAPRRAGVSKYPFRKLLLLWFDLMTGFSMSPLRGLSLAGGLCFLASFALGALLVALRLRYGAGWAAEGVFTLFAVLFFLIGGQFVALGLLGEYVGRIYQDVRGRPRYVIRNPE